MNKKTIRIAGWALGLSMAVAGIGVAALNGAKAPVETKAATESYTLTFKTGAGDGTSGSTESEVTDFLSSGEAYVSGFSEASRAYYAGGSGLKLGASSNAGVLGFNLSALGQVKITTIVVNAKLYNSGKSATLKVNSLSTQSVGSSFGNLTYTVASEGAATKQSSFSITSSKYIWVSSITVNYVPESYSKPLTANPVLSTGSSASVAVGKSISLAVTTTPADTDEPLVITSADTSKVTVSGTSSPFTINGVAITDTPVRVTVAGANGTYKSTVDVTVLAPATTIEDKILTPDAINVTTASYADNNGFDHEYEGVSYTTNQVQKLSGGFQIQKNAGYIYNDAPLHTVDASPAKIKSVTLIMNSGNGCVEAGCYVYEGTSANPSSRVSVSGTYSTTGINTYVFSSDKTYFKIAEAGNKAALKIDAIIVELVDSTSDVLTEARTAASTILTGLTGSCGTGGSGNVSASQWDTLSSNLEALSLSSSAKSLLKSATRLPINALNQGSATIENAMYHYDACVTKFGFAPITALTDARPASAFTTAPSTSSTMSGNNTFLITAVALAGVATAGGLFFLQRKRRNED